MNSDVHPNPRKTTSVRHLGRVDIACLRDAIGAIDEAVWDAENTNKPNRFDALDKTRHIVFRFVDSTQDWRKSHDRPLWSQWREQLMPVMRQATTPYGYVRGSFPRVMLARMAPGGAITPHHDANLAAKWPHKIHVPIQTNPQVDFLVAGKVHHFAEGEAIEVNNMDTHAVYNRGETDRIHLIFEYYDGEQPDPDWMTIPI